MSKTLSTIIVDDELHAVETLAWKLERFYPEVEILEKFTDSSDALEFLQQHPIDLIFLDIEMPRLNGFELLAALEQVDFGVIFTPMFLLIKSLTSFV